MQLLRGFFFFVCPIFYMFIDLLNRYPLQEAVFACLPNNGYLNVREDGCKGNRSAWAGAAGRGGAAPAAAQEGAQLSITAPLNSNTKILRHGIDHLSVICASVTLPTGTCRVVAPSRSLEHADL